MSDLCKRHKWKEIPNSGIRWPVRKVNGSGISHYEQRSIYACSVCGYETYRKPPTRKTTE